MLALLQSILILASVGLPVASLFVWVRLVRDLERGRPWVCFEHRRAVPWGLMTVGAVGLIMLLAAALGSAVAARWSGNGADLVRATAKGQDLPTAAVSSEQVEQAWNDIEASSQARPVDAADFVGLAVGSIGAVLMCYAWLRLAHRATVGDLGYSLRHLTTDLRLGTKAFIALIVPVLLLQIILTQWWPSEHPLAKFLEESPDPANFALVGIVAVIVAPLFEETLFRMLLQGWLEKLDCELQSASGAGSTHSPLLEELRPRAWTIAVSATLFALAHYTHGPDWIPLLLLASGLGYIYQRTHRIQACLVIHFLVNLLAVCQLWYHVASPGPG